MSRNVVRVYVYLTVVLRVGFLYISVSVVRV